MYYLRQDVSPCVPIVTKKSPICGSCPFQYEYKSKRKRGMPKCYVDRAGTFVLGSPVVKGSKGQNLMYGIAVASAEPDPIP